MAKMHYRLVAFPPSWMDVKLLLVEDRVGRLYLFNPASESLDLVFDDEIQSLIQWFDLSQTLTWYTCSELTRTLLTTSNRVRII